MSLFPHDEVPETRGDVPEAHAIIEAAKAEHNPARTFIMLSGGNDSLVLLDVCAPLADEVVHINTGIGVPETNEFAREVGASYGLPFSEWTPPVPYEDLCLTLPVLDGLPGPGVHHVIYSRLKERCVEALLRANRTQRGQRFLLLTGVRQAESKRRMGYKTPINRKGGQVWVNPLLYWSNEQMKDYRVGHNLPVNEVAANLHMSGECLCGAMADQGPAREERALIRFFYPDVDARLSAIEQRCREAGKTYTEWGVKRKRQTDPVGDLCQSCEFRSEYVSGQSLFPDDYPHRPNPETVRPDCCRDLTAPAGVDDFTWRMVHTFGHTRSAVGTSSLAALAGCTNAVAARAIELADEAGWIGRIVAEPYMKHPPALWQGRLSQRR